MTRLKQAWLALCGKLEPEVQELILLGTPEPATLYEVRIAKIASLDLAYGLAFQDRVVSRYHTCEQAHAEHSGMTIVAKQYWRIGGMYLSELQVVQIEVQPKPKRPKGKK